MLRHSTTDRARYRRRRERAEHSAPRRISGAVGCEDASSAATTDSAIGAVSSYRGPPAHACTECSGSTGSNRAAVDSAPRSYGTATAHAHYATVRALAASVVARSQARSVLESRAVR